MGCPRVIEILNRGNLWRIIYWNIEYEILYIRSFHFWFRWTVSETPWRGLIWRLIFTSIGWWWVTWWWPRTRLSNRIPSSFWSCPFSITSFASLAILFAFSWPVLWYLTLELKIKLKPSSLNEASNLYGRRFLITWWWSTMFLIHHWRLDTTSTWWRFVWFRW